MSSYQSRPHSSGNPDLPVGSIQQGTVARIENYGAFVQLQDYPYLRGLVHISQLSNARVEQVTDVVAVDEQVWVQVVEVEEVPNPDGGRPKTRVRLTMKDIPQDGSAREIQRSKEQSVGLSQAIEQNLNSTIGIAVARDPMANQTSTGRNQLILKQDMGRAKGATLINGYALLEDDDDFVPPPAPVPTGDLGRSGPSDTPPVPVRSMGRGRGTTLPAWMVQQQRAKEEALGVGTDKKRSKDERKHKSKKSKYSSRSRDQRKGKKHKRSSMREGSENESDSLDSNSQQKKRRKRSRTREGSANESDSRDSDRRKKKRRRRSRRRESSEDESDESRRRGRKEHKRRNSSSARESIRPGQDGRSNDDH